MSARAWASALVLAAFTWASIVAGVVEFLVRR